MQDEMLDSTRFDLTQPDGLDIGLFIIAKPSGFSDIASR